MSRRSQRSLNRRSSLSSHNSFRAEALERRLFLSGTLNTLYSFTGGSDGQDPSGIAVDSVGNLYGTTLPYDTSTYSTVWELQKGSSTITTLYSFATANDATIGYDPISVAVDASGNLFGTNAAGGTAGDGTLWELARGSGTVTVVHTFTGSDGVAPNAITIDASGNLFGTTNGGGIYNFGTVWELARGSSSLVTLYAFQEGSGGINGIAVDKADNLYGTITAGGADANSDEGTIWELAKGNIKLTTLCSLTYANSYPLQIAIDAGDNLFGWSDNSIHGPGGAGDLWELVRGSSTVTTLITTNYGTYPVGITIDNAGNLYATASFGNPPNYKGSIYEFTPTVGPAAKVVFIQQPSNTFSGIDISPSITVAVEDASGNVVTSDESTVTLSATGGPITGDPVVDNINAIDGIATFTQIALDTPGTDILYAGDGALTGDNSNSFTVAVPWHVDVANMNEISGWAYDPAYPTFSASVEIVISSGPQQSVQASQTRSDLQPVLGTTNHGFNYSTPVLSVGSHTASIYLIRSDGPMLLMGTVTLVSQNSLFDEHYYLQTNPDVAAAVAAGEYATGYDHYIEYGQFEGRSPSPFWDETWYLQENPDVVAAVKAGKISSGFMHYYLYGQYENRNGLLYFNSSYYLQHNPDVAAAVKAGSFSSAFEHFVLFGQYEDRSPMLYFASAVYDADNPDVRPFITGQPCSSDFEQFVEYGQYEGRIASNYYNEATYLADNPDVAAAVESGEFPDGFQHWLEYGQYENRKAV